MRLLQGYNNSGPNYIECVTQIMHLTPFKGPIYIVDDNRCPPSIFFLPRRREELNLISLPSRAVFKASFFTLDLIFACSTSNHPKKCEKPPQIVLNHGVSTPLQNCPLLYLKCLTFQTYLESTENLLTTQIFRL